MLYAERPEHTKFTIGPIFHTTPIMLTKTGRTLRLMARSQYYFTHGGQVHFLINLCGPRLLAERSIHPTGRAYIR